MTQHIQTSYVCICQFCNEDFIAGFPHAKTCKKPECQRAYFCNHKKKSRDAKRGGSVVKNVDGTYNCTCVDCGEEFHPRSLNGKRCPKCIPVRLAELRGPGSRSAKSKHRTWKKDASLPSGSFTLVYDPCGWYEPGMRVGVYDLPRAKNKHVIENRNFAPGTRFQVGSKIKVFDGIDLMDPEGMNS